jgi:2'-5' RNA ligase
VATTAGIHFLTFPDALTAARVTRLAQRWRREFELTAVSLPTSRFHVSLRSLGEYDELEVPEIIINKARQAAAAVRMNPFVVALNRLQSFSRSDGKHPVVLLGDEGVVGLEILQRSLCNALRMAGLRGRSNFTPHMTLLYDCRRIAEQPVDPVCWTVREFALVLSLVGRTKYVLLARWQLQEGGSGT